MSITRPGHGHRRGAALTPRLGSVAGRCGRPHLSATTPAATPGRDDIVTFLHQKRARELEYRLIKGVWTYGDNRIAVRFAYESHSVDG